MFQPSAAMLLRGAAVLLIVCAVSHSASWIPIRARFPADSQPLAALVWFLLAIDWAVLAGMWLIAASGGAAMRALLLVSAAIPLAVAVGLLVTMGPKFPPIYLQLGAALLVIAGALRLK